MGHQVVGGSGGQSTALPVGVVVSLSLSFSMTRWYIGVPLMPWGRQLMVIKYRKL